jgi:hypothetical protein
MLTTAMPWPAGTPAREPLASEDDQQVDPAFESPCAVLHDTCMADAALFLLSCAADSHNVDGDSILEAAQPPGQAVDAPWTPDEDATLVDLHKRYRAGRFMSYAVFLHATSDALGGLRSPIACGERCNQLRHSHKRVPGASPIKPVQLDRLMAAAVGDGGDGTATVSAKPSQEMQVQLHGKAVKVPARAKADTVIAAEPAIADKKERTITHTAAVADAAVAVDGTVAAGNAAGTWKAWSQREDSVVLALAQHWRANKFSSAQQFYDEAVKQLPGRSAWAIEKRLRNHHKITKPPASRGYKPAGQPAAQPVAPPVPPLVHADAVMEESGQETPIPALPADLSPPPLWMLRIPATGEVLGPFLISALRHGVAEGYITAMDAKFVRAWRRDEGEEAAMSLQNALDLPRIPSRRRKG